MFNFSKNWNIFLKLVPLFAMTRMYDSSSPTFGIVNGLAIVVEYTDMLTRFNLHLPTN